MGGVDHTGRGHEHEHEGGREGRHHTGGRVVDRNAGITTDPVRHPDHTGGVIDGGLTPGGGGQPRASDRYGQVPPARTGEYNNFGEKYASTTTSSESVLGRQSNIYDLVRVPDNSDVYTAPVTDEQNRSAVIEQMSVEGTAEKTHKVRNISLALGFTAVAGLATILYFVLKPDDDSPSETQENDDNSSDNPVVPGGGGTVTPPPPPPVEFNAEDDEENVPLGRRIFSFNIVENDRLKNPDIEIDPQSITLIDPKLPTNTGDKIIVQDEGEWFVEKTGDNPGLITFTPADNFYSSPSPIKYTIKDIAGEMSSEATITVIYPEVNTLTLPRAFNYVLAGADENREIRINLLNPPAGQGKAPEPATYEIDANPIYLAGRVRLPQADEPTGTAIIRNKGKTLDVANEGVWTVVTVPDAQGRMVENGIVEFKPTVAFAQLNQDPTAIRYQIADTQGNLSNEAIIAIEREISILDAAIGRQTEKSDYDFWTGFDSNFGNQNLTDINFLTILLIFTTKSAIISSAETETAGHVAITKIESFFPAKDVFDNIFENWVKTLPDDPEAIDGSKLVMITDVDIPEKLDDITLGARLMRLQLLNKLITTLQS